MSNEEKEQIRAFYLKFEGIEPTEDFINCMEWCFTKFTKARLQQLLEQSFWAADDAYDAGDVVSTAIILKMAQELGEVERLASEHSTKTGTSPTTPVNLNQESE